MRSIKEGSNENHEKEILENLLRTKKWNPECLRHSTITANSYYLPKYALKKNVRWSMTPKQGTKSIKRRMSNDLKYVIF